MPPKAKFTQAQILNAAFEMVRQEGMDALSTRGVAKKLRCSTMPVYTCLKSKQNLEDTIAARALEILLKYESTPRTGDTFIDMGLGYVLFARDEKHLFRCICNEEHAGLFKRVMQKQLDALVEGLAAYPLVEGMPMEDIYNFVHQGWVYAHGLAHLVNTGFYPDLGDEEIQGLMEYTGQRYIRGFETLEKGRE
ncbi:MAG: TetR/AcrR family transcriptional regulator [Desulfatibacillum sp.]|nr:TetR/AcrR family transcriptional regulator [Desulfatibacillum sp.]